MFWNLSYIIFMAQAFGLILFLLSIQACIPMFLLKQIYSTVSFYSNCQIYSNCVTCFSRQNTTNSFPNDVEEQLCKVVEVQRHRKVYCTYDTTLFLCQDSRNALEMGPIHVIVKPHNKYNVRSTNKLVVPRFLIHETLLHTEVQQYGILYIQYTFSVKTYCKMAKVDTLHRMDLNNNNNNNNFILRG